MQDQHLNGAQFLIAFYVMAGTILLGIGAFFIWDWWRNR